MKFTEWSIAAVDEFRVPIAWWTGTVWGPEHEMMLYPTLQEADKVAKHLWPLPSRFEDIVFQEWKSESE